ncbi:UNVERIFIED_CONTAM: hypothetical protein HDU68_007224 [Siphonaria sp. JEL0065]|nr:hypothetical protein HDU68_007224 [Siphonaria sp. JEL0065]
MDEEFEELKDWFLEHVDLIDGAETSQRLVFLADSGLDQASMDRRYSNLGADEIGQEWLLDGEGWNRFDDGTRVWNLYKRNIIPQSQLTHYERKKLDAAIRLNWYDQRVEERNRLIRVKNPNAMWRNDIRDWDADDMVEYFLVKLGGVIPSTGLKMTPERVDCDR